MSATIETQAAQDFYFNPWDENFRLVSRDFTPRRIRELEPRIREIAKTHVCIGAPSARMEGSIAIGAALERFPHLRLKNPDAPLTYKGSYFLRGLSRLDMALK